MTTPSDMTDEELRIKVAELRGAHRIDAFSFEVEESVVDIRHLPPLTLDEMHEAEKMLSLYQQSVFVNVLDSIVKFNGGNWFGAIHASARQRAEAFIKTMEAKWAIKLCL